VDAAAIVSQKALLKTSYAPYARIMKRVCWEESFHILHGRDVVLAMVTGTESQRELVQEALDRWWEPLMMFHGTPIPAEDDPMYHWRIKSQANEDARQEFLDGYVNQILELGLTIPDPKLRKTGQGRVYTEPDWDELRGRHGHGPGDGRAIAFRRLSGEETAWVRRGGWPTAPSAGVGGLSQGAQGPAVRARGVVPAPTHDSRRCTRREFYGRRHESEALWLVPAARSPRSTSYRRGRPTACYRRVDELLAAGRFRGRHVSALRQRREHDLFGLLASPTTS
jgi:hypothetical protein